MMRDSSYDLSYSRGNVNIDPQELAQQGESEFEIMFDAAQCLKFGRDILMNVSNENHRLGLRWLKEVLGDQYRFHEIHLCDLHIDTMLMPIAPGKLLINSGTMPEKLDLLPKPLRQWDIIKLDIQNKESYQYNLTSTHIYANVLPIGPNQIIIFNENRDPDPVLAHTLEKNRIDFVHVRLRHSRLFGGGPHCATLDTHREEALEDYFT